MNPIIGKITYPFKPPRYAVWANIMNRVEVRSDHQYVESIMIQNDAAEYTFIKNRNVSYVYTWAFHTHTIHIN
jgi:hypothetical protein